jgi:hypothetical protein
MLTQGETFAGVAADDAHHTSSTSARSGAPRAPRPRLIQVSPTRPDRDRSALRPAKRRLPSATPAGDRRITVKNDNHGGPHRADVNVESIGKKR